MSTVPPKELSLRPASRLHLISAQGAERREIEAKADGDAEMSNA